MEIINIGITISALFWCDLTKIYAYCLVLLEHSRIINSCAISMLQYNSVTTNFVPDLREI